MIELTIKVKPNSKNVSIKTQDGILVVRLTKPSVDGKANKQLLGVLSDYFSVSRSLISIKSGAKSRIKKIIVDN